MVTIYDHPGDGEDRLMCPKVGGGFGNYCSFGFDAYGNEYYCQWDTEDAEGREFVGVMVNGGPVGDTLQFWWWAAGQHYDMDAYLAKTVFGKAYGFGEGDEIIGSRSTNPLYSDRLFGGQGEDRICSFAGADFANGDGGDDDVCGDDGLDHLIGGLGHDTVCGLEGNGDRLEGAAGNDFLSHGDDGGFESNDGGPHTAWDTCDAAYSSLCEFSWTEDPCDSL